MEKTTASLLVVDDEPVIHTVIQMAFRNPGYRLLFAETCEQALAVARSTTAVDVCLLDKNLSDGSGLDIIKDLKIHQPDIEVLLITGYPSVESAVEALRVGAFDYIEKPLDSIDTLKLRVQNALERVALKRHQKNYSTSSDGKKSAMSEPSRAQTTGSGIGIFGPTRCTSPLVGKP